MFLIYLFYFFFFFFQAEDGIRDRDVTGVQTCALPISPAKYSEGASPRSDGRRTPHGARRDHFALPPGGSGSRGLGEVRAAHPRLHALNAVALERDLDLVVLDRSEEHTSELQSHHDIVCR